jgi:adenylate cyclase
VLGATRVFYRRGDEPTAIRQLRAGLARNPNLAMGWGFLGVSLCYLGETSEGLAALERASLLNPYDPLLFLWKQGEAVGHFTAARYEQAIASAGEAVSLHPNWSLSYRYLAAAFAHLGRLDEAVAALQTSLKLDPNYTITIARDVTPLHEEALERLIDGLRKASLQE